MKLCLAYIFLFISGTLTAQKLPHNNNQQSTDIKDENAFLFADCKILLEKNDPYIVEFQSYPLFSYTPPKVKRILTDKNLMDADAHIYTAENSVFLILDIRINSKNAPVSYGELEYDARLKLEFQEGAYLYLKNIERDKGKVNRSNDYTEYQGVFPLSGADIKTLKKEYIYKLGIMWEEGFEEYEVFNIDLIKNQLNCLK